jgi:hypothetical protein
VVENTGEPGQPSVHREYLEHPIEIHLIAFHTHPYHSQRKCNPPTSANVKLFSIFCSYSRVRRPLDQIRAHHIVFTMQSNYVMHDSGISNKILKNLVIDKDNIPFRKQVCKEAGRIFNGMTDKAYEKQLLEAFPKSPGLAGVDRASDNTKVSFFQDKGKHKDYLDFFKVFGITIDFFATPDTEIALRLTKL